MSRTRSALGEIVNFELIAIKQQLASNPVPKTVEDRRRFIDEKDGVRTTKVVEPSNALLVGLEAAEESAEAESNNKKK